MATVEGNEREHVFWELVVGAYLANQGLEVEYERRLDRKTPDWCLLDSRGAVETVIEVATLRAPYQQEMEIRQSLGEGRIHTMWSDSALRLFQKLEQKTDAYEELCVSSGIGYVVSLFTEFFANIEQDDVDEAVSGEHGLFRTRTGLSGV